MVKNLFPHIKTDRILIKTIREFLRALAKSPNTAMMRGLRLLLADFLVSYEIPYKEDIISFTELPPTSTNCSVCGKPQRTCPSGVVCENGHGGVDPL